MTRLATRPPAPLSVACTSALRALTSPPSRDTCVTLAAARARPLYARVEVMADVVELAPRCVRESVPVDLTRPQTVFPSSRAKAVACALAGRDCGARATALATPARTRTARS